MRRPAEEEARKFLANAQFLWHQQFELASGVSTPGVNPIPWLFEASGFPAQLRGKTVLDVGTTNGAVAFEAERRGAARVVAVDIFDAEHFGFRALKELFASNAEFVQCSLYQLADVLMETFDVVVFWGVLYHLRHPLLGLDALRRLARDVVFVETAVSDARDDPTQPTARFHRLGDLGNDGSNWWSPTTTVLDAWCRSAGFDVESMKRIPDDQAPTRCIARLRVVPGSPEYLRVSYEQSAAPEATYAAVERPEVAASPPELPPAVMREMVAGTEDATWFADSGRRSVDDLIRALDAARRPLESFTDVLEFGCGCGRMSRWLLDRPGTHLTGIDIDQPMIDWCKEHLPGGTFETDPPLPPTRFADRSFDLVVNHSVFTHLDEEYQDRWLAELARITRPDGVLVLSFSGELPFSQYEEATAAVDARIAAERRAELEERGILFIIDETDRGFPDFYNATFHTAPYVLEHWLRWFELLVYLPRNNLDFQDVVVLTPRDPSRRQAASP